MASMASPLLAAVLVLLAAAAGATAQKPGACSPPTAASAGICALACYSDLTCPGAEKCCPTGCGGTTCSPPVTAPALQNSEKAGACPAAAATAWVCASRCSRDADCGRGRLKCCRTRCGGYACLAPVAGAARPDTAARNRLQPPPPQPQPEPESAFYFY